ncbi:MAG: hypothetical protein ACRYFX_13520 [Janthinobacterium lividum]
MKNILKAIGGGLLFGIMLFAFPFLGRLLLFVVLLRGVLRLLGRGRRGFGRRGFGPGRRMRGPGSFGPSGHGGPMPIDSHWYRPSVTGNGPSRTISIS